MIERRPMRHLAINDGKIFVEFVCCKGVSNNGVLQCTLECTVGKFILRCNNMNLMSLFCHKIVAGLCTVHIYVCLCIGVLRNKTNNHHV